MKISDWLTQSKHKLGHAGIETAELDCLVLLQDVLGQEKAFILTHLENVLTKKQLLILNERLGRRIKHEPLAYIRGYVEFYGRNFIVDKNVLVPRPETETMIEELKLLASKSEQLVLTDVGCGSGAIGITAKLEIPDSKVYLTDIDKNCLGISERNSRVLKTTVVFEHGDLLAPLADKKLDIVLANLPYVPNDYTINEAARKEPPVALFGGDDGLDLYRQLFEQISALPRKPGHVLTESLPMQHKALNKIAKQASYKLLRTNNFISVFVLT